MFHHRTKNILLAILLLCVLGMPFPIRSYERLVGLSPDFSLLVYFFGLALGFATMFAAIALDICEQKQAAPVVLKKLGVAVLVEALVIVAAMAVFVGSFLAGYMPEKTGFSDIAYIAGFGISFAAVCILYYLPKYLPQEEGAV